MGCLQEDMWVGVACARDICRPWQRLRGECHSFGEEINDFSMLCEVLAWDLPHGAVIIHVDKECAMICAPGNLPRVVEVTSALAWLKGVHDQAFGIVLRRIGNSLKGAFLDVTSQPRIDKEKRSKRRRTIIRAIEEIVNAGA